MTARVQVVIEAKDEASGILRGITSQMGSFGGVVEELTGTTVNWGNVATQATMLVVDVMKKAWEHTTAYAEEVRNLSLVSGTSAEASSRLIQVLDDYQLTTQDAMTATRALTRNGLAPTVETIAELSNKYLSLNTAQEKNQFLIDNFGRGGAEWANLLKQGGDAILKLNEGVNQNNIITDQQILNMEISRLAIDSVKDSYDGFLTQLGLNMGMVLAYNQAMVEADKIYAEQVGVIQLTSRSTEEYKTILDGVIASQITTARVTEEAGRAAAGSVPNWEKQISAMRTLTGATQEQVNSLAFMMLQEQLASDGIVTPDEFQLLTDAGIAMGVFDENTGKAYQQIGLLNQYLADGKIDVDQYTESLNLIPAYIETEIHTIYTEEGTPPEYPSTSSTNTPQFTNQEYDGLMASRSTRAIEESVSGTVNNFYAPVTLQVDASVIQDILEYR